jgi:class 3 adenylate cyclase
MRCSRCGADNRDVAKFCDSCGASLSVESPAIVAKRPAAVTGERRYLTVLFCDLVNSTAIATQLKCKQLPFLAGLVRNALNRPQ